MGDRYYLKIICPKCNTEHNDVYFAPTCGFINWKCPTCSHVIDLCKYTGISYEDASNADLIKQICMDIENIKEHELDQKQLSQ